MTVGERSSWGVLVAAGPARHCREVGLSVLDVLRAEERIQLALDRAAQSGHPPGWRSTGTASGYAGLALACGQRDLVSPGEGWDEVAHLHLSRAVAALPSQRPGLGLCDGVCGLAFTARTLSRGGGSGYGRLLGQLDPRIQELAVRMSQAAKPGDLPRASFDVVSGLAGIGRYLLLAAPGDSGALRALGHVLDRIAMLIGDDPAVGLATRREYLPAEQWPDAPNGIVDCGLAHGVPGPVALLALASLAGVSSPDHDAALATGAEWLCANRADDQFGPNWPYALAVAVPTPTAGARTAWCYGAPGVARTLWLAGDALGRDDLRDLALESLQGVLRRPVGSREIDSPTFCHGVAGLLQIVLRMVCESGEAELLAGASSLVEQLLDQHEPDSLLGFRALAPGGAPVDSVDLIDGVAGVGLVLLSASVAIEPVWDRLFLLS